MLYIMPSASDARGVAASLRHPEIHPVTIVRAHSLSHLEIGAGERTELARDWLNGRSIVVPTARLAGEVFGISERHVRRAECKSATPPALGLLAAGWLHCTEAERAAFITEYEADVLAVLDHLTAPQAISPESDEAEAEYQLWLNEQDERRLANQKG